MRGASSASIADPKRHHIEATAHVGRTRQHADEQQRCPKQDHAPKSDLAIHGGTLVPKL